MDLSNRIAENILRAVVGAMSRPAEVPGRKDGSRRDSWGDPDMRSHIQTVIGLTLFTILGGPALAPGEPEMGAVGLPKDMTIDLRCSFAGTGNPAVLPQGGYTLYRWSIRRTDEQGIPWTGEGYVPNDKSLLQVVKDQQTQLPVGEPFVSTLTATKRGSEITFDHKLQGRLGETIAITKGGERSPSQLRIRNGDRSYDRTLTFAYG